MKVTIEYDGHEERHDLLQAIHAPDAFGVLWDIDQRARAILKHGEPSKDLAAFCEEVREAVREVPEVE